ncbi:MAG TPA: pilus assembly protein TadG-related protein [Candidatus Limnocylindria bacterium]|nr:pilus assembly protein TadG-related protein [Candidatus Limnocylindria bacterium]
MRFLRGRESEGGQAVVLIAITFLALIMAVGLAIDSGQLFVARRTMQEAADAGAYAGAVVRYQGGSVLQARLAAIADTTKNGYTDGVGGFAVTVNVPPLTGLYVGNDKYVEVNITGTVQTALVPGGALTTVHVRAVGGADPLNNGYAIMALDRGNTPSAFNASPNADIHLTGGGILVNSSSATAATSSQCNAARFTISVPYGTDVDGNGSGCFPSTGDGLRTGQPQQADPFAGFPKPSTTGMTTYTTMAPVINPGIYNVQLGGAGNTTINMNSGIYILKYGINATGNADLISNAGGVFIFNTHTNYPGAFRPGIDTCGPLNLAGNAVTDVEAMTTGTYANFLVYQDPACTNDMVIAGNGSFLGTGSIYLPTAGFRFNGNNATLTGSQLVAKTVDIQNGNITIDFNAGNTAQPILPRLAE